MYEGHSKSSTSSFITLLIGYAYIEQLREIGLSLVSAYIHAKSKLMPISLFGCHGYKLELENATVVNV